jgi:hypothetical protein
VVVCGMVGVRRRGTGGADMEVEVLYWINNISRY